jgi:phytanoyl-CoA hydroxylase
MNSAGKSQCGTNDNETEEEACVGKKALVPCISFCAAILVWLVLGPTDYCEGTPTGHGLKPELKCSIIVQPNASQLERLAAVELRQYLYQLYGVQAGLTHSLNSQTEIYLIIGNPYTNRAVKVALGRNAWPKLSDQGFVLKRVAVNGRPGLLLGGGSPEATLWAVYDFVERAGVRFLLEKDVFPEKPAAFPPAELDVVKEPDFRFRSYRGVNDLATSLVFYGMKDYRHLIDQLAKMKFNVFYVQTYPFQPFVHYEFRGQKKTTGVLHYGWKLPIHSETIGKDLFRGQSELINPELEGAHTYEARVEASTRLLHNLFAYAKSRGLKTGLMFWINQFTDEFTRRLPEWSARAYVSKELLQGSRSARLGVSEDGVDPISFPHMTPNNPVVMELNRTILRAHVDTYPEVDYYGLFQPELPKSGEEYKDLWRRLNTKYQLEPQFSLAQMVESATQNTLKGDQTTMGFLFPVSTMMQKHWRSTSGPVKSWIDEIFEVCLQMKKLTSEQKRFFETEGFLSYAPFLTLERIRQLGNSLDAIASGEMEYPSELIRWEPIAEQLVETGQERKNLVYQIRYPHRHIPLFLEHATDSAILDPVEDLLGPDIVIYNTQALLKPAFHGTSQPWHQDSAYWPIRPCNLVTCWIPLDEANPENGCMHFIPGSHRSGLLEHKAGRVLTAASGGTAAAVQEVSVDESQGVAAPARPGYGSFHHSLTLHGTAPNRSPHRRRAIICSYMSLDFSFTGPESDRPSFHLVRGKRAGDIV